MAERTGQLRESEAKLRAIFDNTPDFIMVIDRNLRIQFINHTVSGFEVEKVIGTDIYAYLQPAYHAIMRNSIQLVFKTGRAERLETKAAGPDGTISWYLTTLAPLPRDDRVQAIAMLATDITGHKRAEQALRESEMRYRHLVEYSPDAIIIICEDRLVYANPASAKMIGADNAEQFFGKPAMDFVHPNCLELAAGHVRQVIAEKKKTPLVELTLVRLDGTFFQVEAVGIPFTYQSQPAVQVIARDITASKQAEEKLKIFSHAIKHSIDGIIIADLDAVIIYHNDASATIYGYESNEMLGKNASILNGSSEISSAELNLITRQHGGWSGELQQKKKDGRIITVALTTSLIQDESGRVLGMLGILRDITNRKHEEERVAREASHLQALFKALPDLYFRIDADGTIIGYSGHDELELYVPPDRFLGKLVHAVLPQSAADQIKCATTKALQKNALVTVEYALSMSQGEQYYEARLSPVLGKEVIALVRNVTARKRIEEHTQRCNEELERQVAMRTQRIYELERQRAEVEKLAATGRMAARIAHEINNPLGAIRTAFRLVSRAVPAAHHHHHYIGKIEKEVQRIATIVRQMLDLHRPQTESPRAFHLNEVIREILTLLKPKFDEQRIRFALEANGATAKIELPENMLRQILYNVILNAVEASPHDDLVRIRAEIAAHCLHIAVIDHGYGIPEEIKDRIFEPFFTTKGNRDTGGLGLGLAICKSLMEAMNGTITFDSEPAEGTICRIAIPLDFSEKTEKD